MQISGFFSELTRNEWFSSDFKCFFPIFACKMQNPPVWQFEEPRATFTTSKHRDFDGLQREIDRFTFTHLVSTPFTALVR